MEIFLIFLVILVPLLFLKSYADDTPRKGWSDSEYDKEVYRRHKKNKNEEN